MAGISALELTLLEMGHKFTPGAAVAAAQQSFAAGIKA
jgi:hypothetical protein